MYSSVNKRKGGSFAPLSVLLWQTCNLLPHCTDLSFNALISLFFCNNCGKNRLADTLMVSRIYSRDVSCRHHNGRTESPCRRRYPCVRSSLIRLASGVVQHHVQRFQRHRLPLSCISNGLSRKLLIVEREAKSVVIVYCRWVRLRLLSRKRRRRGRQFEGANTVTFIARGNPRKENGDRRGADGLIPSVI